MDAPKTPRQNQEQLEEENAVVDADLILQHKENIQPLASGRRAAALAGSLTATPKQKDTRLVAERTRLLEEAELAIDNDDDPLVAWIRYVEWTVDNYPQGASVESGLLDLLERATRLFANDPRYKNDMRYLKLWIQYASYVDHPVKIYSYLDVNDIGTAYALFYEEYCNALELCGRRAEALEMYDIGIARRAHPLARLQARKRDFSIRMMSKPIDAAESSNLSASQNGRKGLGERKAPGSSQQRSEARTPSSTRGQGQARSQSNNRGNFQIYAEDEDQSGGGNAWPDLETREAHRKENYRSAVPAQGQILNQPFQDMSRTPRVQVYVDEGAMEPKTPSRPNNDDGLATLSSKKPGIDTLKRDPLRNHTQPAAELGREPEPEPISEDPFRKSLKDRSNSQRANQTEVPKADASKSKGKAKPKSSKSLPSVKPNERLEMNISLLILPDGTEIHPLERRARDSGLADKKWPYPSPEQRFLSRGTEGDLFSPRPGDHHVRVDFEATRLGGFGNTTHMSMSKDATVTINTKEALMAVYGMYNSPTKSLTGGKVLIDPAASSAPTPMPSNAPRDENLGTVQRTPFQPFIDEATPSISKISTENQRTPGLGFRTPGASKGLSTGKRTLSLKQVLQPVTSFPEEDEEEGYEPVTPAPIRHAKPLATITPFVDEEPNPVPDKPPVGSTSPRDHYHDHSGPREENDLFSVSTKSNQAFQPYQDDEEEAPDEEEEEEEWDGEEEEAVPETDGEEISEEGEEYYDEEACPADAARWAPALTPITERTYEHTGNWTTPLHIRDMTVMDTPFSAVRAKREAERLAAEIREEEVIEEEEEREDEEEEEEEERGSTSLADAPDMPLAQPIICDPYTKKMTAQLIETLPIPTNHRDLQPKTCGQLEKLQKFVNPKTRKSASSTPRRVAEDTYSLNLDGDEYEIHRKLGEGGFGAVFLADDIGLLEGDHEDDSGHRALVAIKILKPAAVWESYALDRIHSTVDESIRKSIISPRRLYLFQDESYHILDFSNHGTLLEAVNKAGDLKIGSGSGMGNASSSIPGMDEMLVMFFTVELLKTIEGLHSSGFIHGDLKIDNCMVRLEECDEWLNQYDPKGGGGWSSKGVMLIDFGRAIDTSLFPRGTSFVTDWKMDKRDCLEMREGRPWTYETDYYGVAGVVYCMLYGKYMELPIVRDGIQKLSTTLKRYWRTALWERLFSALLNPNGFGRPLPIVDELRVIRKEMEAWLVENGNRNTRPATLRGLLKRLQALSM